MTCSTKFRKAWLLAAILVAVAGVGAAWCEQLSYYLGRPVDRLALNSGGALNTRQRLAQDLATGNDRLAGKKVVVYQFAMRELAIGDWRLIALGGGR